MATVLLPLAEGFEDLEAVAVIDILRRAGIGVTVAGLGDGPVRGSRETTVVPDARLGDVMGREFDMLVLPGGMPGVKHLREDARIKTLLERYRDKRTAAICAAPSILAAYGMLDGKRVTSNPKFREQVAVGGVDYREDDVVVDGSLVTSRGAGTAIPFALALVEMLAGRAKRDEVEAGLVMARGQNEPRKAAHG
ncbi:4-methyl-5(B-hydroxyethyl)-thiazole monophosphate biosynthesis protein [Sulfurifustis variabilis]|uniref:4-methyl-5(B-hydroxyethyl)-thiazole monophosphate biosynthesis protein n=1 Tax=Sulfurifustis variabilis TaxID=1675686 RepID=A0A1B4VBR8_9GAMM|nr:DJ-1 family glyoxalase III [Sulfurifustis variabilis]BAU49994.1 4-methyl-5(B-hydroxyethyl)-thiazole monophosphate biosynthesis protein [Sulfurifustis variabilis]